MLIDSHCHLDFPDFANELAPVRTRAKAAGIGLMLTICTHVERFDHVLAVAERCDEVFCTVGTHPHEAEQEQHVTVERLLEAAENPRVVGFGETGLDYFYLRSPKEMQERAFRTHIAAARASNLPLVIHTRDAEDDTIRILEDEARVGPVRGVFHCFGGTQRLADAALALGFYVSFSGVLTFKKANDLRQVAETIPLDRLLVETDAPYLAPVPMRGKRNEPSYVVHTAQELARLKGVSAAELASTTTSNFLRLFDKARISCA